MVLIDATWWFGGNRARGIGRYLDGFFRFAFPLEKEEVVWLVPASAARDDVTKLARRYGGSIWEFPVRAPLAVQRRQLEHGIKKRNIRRAILPSPFERPWSLVDLRDALLATGVPGQAVVFDVLPLEFPDQILAEWPEEDQALYKARVRFLADCKKIWAISSVTKNAMARFLNVSKEKIEVPDFVFRDDWLVVPKNLPREILSWQAHPLVVTISGGEWRKNLDGTLAYFARAFSSEYHLVVICKLGLRDRWRVMQRAAALGILHRVKVVGEVSEATKWAYLHAAAAFLFLPHAEGLGIPLLEAKKAGVPRVVVSKELCESELTQYAPGFFEVALPKLSSK